MKFKILSFLLLLLTIKTGSLLGMQTRSRQEILDGRLLIHVRLDNGSPEALYKVMELINEGANPHFVIEPREINYDSFGNISTIVEQVKTFDVATDRLKQLFNQRCQKLK